MLVGPTLHVWFGVLFRTFPQAGLGGALRKMAADQLLFAPLFNPVFICFVYALEGRLAEAPDTLRAEWLNITVSNWKLWAPAQALNFLLVPVQFQVMFANFVAVIWNTYLSWKSHLDEEQQAAAAAASGGGQQHEA